MRTRLVTFTTALLLALLAAAPVWAASPYAIGAMDVQVWPEAEPGATAVIVGVTLDRATKLPVTVRIPFPEGMRLQWAGEIAAEGTISDDVRRPVVIKQGDGGPYAEFELKDSTSGQLEAVGATPTVSGNRAKVDVEFVQSVAATLTAFSVRLPAGVSDVKISPSPAGAPATNEAGESLYTLPSERLKDGDSLRVKVDYSTLPAETPFESGTSTGTSGYLIGILAGLVVVAVVVLVVVVRRQSPQPDAESDDSADDEE